LFFNLINIVHVSCIELVENAFNRVDTRLNFTKSKKLIVHNRFS